MVGGESLGCRTCKQRRIKCDERRPICRQCEKSKRYCPGPESRFRYHYGSTAQRSRLLDDLGIDEEIISSDEDGRQDRSLSPKSVTGRASSKAPHPTIDPAHLISTRTYRLQHAFVQALSYLSFADGTNLRDFGPYWRELPRRLGHNEALDATVDCFLHLFPQIVQHGVSKRQRSPGEFIRMNRAIKAVREAVPNFESQRSPELLCATLLLAACDYYTQAGTYSSAVQLSRGTDHFFRALGPSSSPSDFQTALFGSHYPVVILHNLLYGCSCQGRLYHVEQQQWTTVLQNYMGVDTLVWFWSAMARLPCLVESVRGFTASKAVTEETQLLQQVTEFRIALTAAQSTMEDILARSNGVFDNVVVWCPQPQQPSSPTLKACISLKKYKMYAVYQACFIVAHSIEMRLTQRSNATAVAETSRTASRIGQMLPHWNNQKPFESLVMVFTAAAAYGGSSSPPERVQVCEILAEKLGRLRDADLQDARQQWHNELELVFEAITGGSALPS